MTDFFELLVRASLNTSIAVLIVAALRKPLRSLGGARLAYALWLLVPLAMASAAAPPPPKALSLAPQPMGEFLLTQGSGLPQIAATKAYPAALHTLGDNFQALALVLWGLGFAVFGAAVVMRQRRYLAALGKLSPDPLLARVFRASGPAASPAVIGTLRAFIVLPADFEAMFDEEERGLVLAHERTHLSHRHPLDGGLGA